MTSPAVRGYDPVEMTDAALVHATLDGDPAAFTKLVDRYSPSCLRFATRMLGSREDAEDATQEALVRAHRNLARFDVSLSFRAWLMSILVNRCRSSLLYRRRRAMRVVLDEDAVTKASVPPATGDMELRDAIEDALRRIDPMLREAFLLKHVEQLSYEEMMAITAAGKSALKMRVQRACERLQAILEEDRHA